MDLKEIISLVGSYRDKKNEFAYEYCRLIEEGLYGLLLRHPDVKTFKKTFPGSKPQLSLFGGICIRYQGRFINMIRIDEDNRTLLFGYRKTGDNDYLSQDTPDDEYRYIEPNYHDTRNLYASLEIVFIDTELIDEYRALKRNAVRKAEARTGIKEDLLTDGDDNIGSAIHQFLYGKLKENRNFPHKKDNESYIMLFPASLCINYRRRKYNCMIVENTDRHFGEAYLGYAVNYCYMFDNETRYQTDDYAYEFNKFGKNDKPKDMILLYKEDLTEYILDPDETYSTLIAIDIISQVTPLEDLFVLPEEWAFNPKNL